MDSRCPPWFTDESYGLWTKKHKGQHMKFLPNMKQSISHYTFSKILDAFATLRFLGIPHVLQKGKR